MHIFRRRPGFYGDHPIDRALPVLILGGKENALSLARTLGRVGIEVGVSGPADCWALYSGYAARRYPVPATDSPEEFWRRLLVGNNAAIQCPAVLLPCSDDAIEFLAAHEPELRRRHLFDSGPARQKTDLLNKERTLEMAESAGIGAPKFWPVVRGEPDTVDLDDCQFPVIVKPHNTYRFAKTFGRKFFIVETGPAEARDRIAEAHKAGFDITIVEMIPGPDDRLSSYYTYIDDRGECLFHFTKRVIRRYPVHRGGGTYHVTDWLPETAQEGLRFFQANGFRGLGNIEFKKDVRDGQLKIMEVNARFTAAQELAIQAGVPIDLIVYCALTGQAAPAVPSYARDMRLWYPVRDFLAFLQLRDRGDLTFPEWLKSLPFFNCIDPLLDPADPGPTLRAAGTLLGKAIGEK